MKIKPTFGCHLTAYLLLSTCLGTAALAQDTTTFLETITLTTDRAGGTILDVPSNTTVVDEDQIEGRDIDDLEDLVRTVPGVDISRQTSSTDPFNSIGGVTIRGVGGNRVALQVDGSRVAERITDGTRDYFDLSFTKQAEIVRGPASVLWGADALGGIIALETLDPEDLLEGRERGGRSTLSFDSLNDRMTGEAAFAQSFGSNLEVLLGYKREQSHEIEKSKARDDGGIMPCSREVAYGATTCGETDPMTEKTDRLLAKAVWTPNAEQRLEFSADILQRETHVDQLLDLSATNHSRTRDLDLSRHRYGIEHTWTPGSNVISEVKTTLAYTPHSYESRSNKIFTNTGGDMIRDYDVLNYYEDFLELDVQATAEFSTGAADHRVIFGFDGDTTSTDYQRISQETNLTTGIADAPEYAGGFNFANAQTQRADLYVEDRITLGNGLEVTPGLRLATYKIDPQPDSDYQIVPGAEPNVRKSTKLLKSLGLQYEISDTTSVWAKYGEGFKMPTAQQLFQSLPGSFFQLVPAPDLEPEYVESYELGLRHETGSGYAAINAFKSDYTNFIQSFYNIPGTNQYTYRNLSEVSIWGVEASGAFDLNATTWLGFSASWQKGEQKYTSTSDASPHNLPPLMATVTLGHEFVEHDLTVEAVATFAGDVKETSTPDGFKPDAYALLDLYGKWQFMDNAALNVGIQNVFDTRYFTADAIGRDVTVSDSVANGNPIELMTGAGRTFQVSLNLEF